MSRAISAMVTISLFGCAHQFEISETEERIKEARSTLSLREQQIREESPSSLTPTRHVEVELRHRPIQSWLDETTGPGLTVNVVGVSRSGDIIYRPGLGKAWLDPAHDTKGFTRLQNLVLNGETGALGWSAVFSAGVETRVRFSILGAGGNVSCSGSVPSTPAVGIFVVGTPTGVTLPYRLTFGSGGRPNVRVQCGLGALGTVSIDFPLGTVGGDSAGTFDIGLRQSGEVSIPGFPTTKVMYWLSLVRPEVALSEHSLIVKSDLEIRLER